MRNCWLMAVVSPANTEVYNPFLPNRPIPHKNNKDTVAVAEFVFCIIKLQRDEGKYNSGRKTEECKEKKKEKKLGWQYHVSIVLAPCQYHVNLMSVSCQYHVSIVPVPCEYHVSFVSVSCQYHACTMSVLCQSDVNIRTTQYCLCQVQSYFLHSSSSSSRLGLHIDEGYGCH